MVISDIQYTQMRIHTSLLIFCLTLVTLASFVVVNYTKSIPSLVQTHTLVDEDILENQN